MAKTLDLNFSRRIDSSRLNVEWLVVGGDLLYESVGIFRTFSDEFGHFF